MKTCECGGMWYRHGKTKNGERYRCAACGKCITVRDGQIVQATKKGRPRVNDWRTQ